MKEKELERKIHAFLKLILTNYSFRSQVNCYRYSSVMFVVWELPDEPSRKKIFAGGMCAFMLRVQV
jgi:hypothetical protein